MIDWIDRFFNNVDVDEYLVIHYRGFNKLRLSRQFRVTETRNKQDIRHVKDGGDMDAFEKGLSKQFKLTSVEVTSVNLITSKNSKRKIAWSWMPW